MCRKIFIAATGQNTGKTTISLSLFIWHGKNTSLVGFIKAVGPKCQEFNGCIVDKDAALIAKVFGMEEDIRLMSPVVLGRGLTKRFLDGDLTTANWKEDYSTPAGRWSGSTTSSSLRELGTAE